MPQQFLVINGDIISNINLRKAIIRFKLSSSPLMVFSKEIKRPFEFGELIIKRNKIIQINEKPLMSSEIVAGIYLFKKKLISQIPKNKQYGMDQLIKSLLKKKIKIDRYLIDDFWLDVGDIKYFKKK